MSEINKTRKKETISGPKFFPIVNATIAIAADVCMFFLSPLLLPCSRVTPSLPDKNVRRRTNECYIDGGDQIQMVLVRLAIMRMIEYLLPLPLRVILLFRMYYIYLYMYVKM